MADITKDSFREAQQHTKVVFQRGRDVTDYELNEFQDILRVQMFRALKDGVAGALNPGSNDNGYKVVGTGAANSVTISAGVLFCDGIPLVLEEDIVFDGFTTAPDSRDDIVYLAVTEIESSDPNGVPQLGDNSRRRRLDVSIHVVEGAGLPEDSEEPIWLGGIRHFRIATVHRVAGTAAIENSEVEDNRYRLPAFILGNITHQYPQSDDRPPLTLGNWSMTVGDGVNTFGDVNSTDDINGIRLALDIVADLGWPCVTLYIKPGSYFINSQANTIFISRPTVLIGSGKNTNIVHIDSDEDASILASSQFLLVRNMTMYATGSEGAASAVTSSGVLILEDVTIQSQRITLDQFVGTSNFYAVRTIFDQTVGEQAGPFVHVTGTGQVATGVQPLQLPNYVMKDCVFKAAAVSIRPAILVSAFDSELQHIEGKFYFTNCRFFLGGTNGTFGSQNNPSVFGTETPSEVVNQLHDIAHVEFINCDVYADFAKQCTHSTLLYLPHNQIKRLVIDGGTWSLGRKSSQTIPIYTSPGFECPIAIDGLGYAHPETPTNRSIEMRNVHLGWIEQTPYEGGDYLDGYGSLGEDDGRVQGIEEQNLAAFVLCAETVRLQNVKVIGGVAQSGVGEFTISARWAEVDGLDLGGPGAGGSGVLPRQRVMLYYGRTIRAGSRMSFRNFKITYDYPTSPVFDSEDPIIDATSLAHPNTFSTFISCHASNLDNFSFIKKSESHLRSVRIVHCSANGFDVTDDDTTALLHEPNRFTFGPLEVHDVTGSPAFSTTMTPEDLNAANIWAPVSEHLLGNNAGWLRVYVGTSRVSNQGKFIVTVNARWDHFALTWTRDTPALRSMKFDLQVTGSAAQLSVSQQALASFSAWAATEASLRVDGILTAATSVAAPMMIITDGDGYVQYNPARSRSTKMPLLLASGPVFFMTGDPDSSNNTLRFSGDFAPSYTFNHAIRIPLIRSIRAGDQLGSFIVRGGWNLNTFALERHYLNGSNYNTIENLATATAGALSNSNINLNGGSHVIADDSEYYISWKLRAGHDDSDRLGNYMKSITRQWSDGGLR